jgi:death on curing protein
LRRPYLQRQRLRRLARVESVEVVLSLYAQFFALTDQEASHHLQDQSRLESALARPKHAAYYEEADLPRQAATLLWGIIRNHPFIDGNKRVAWITTQYFLNLNGQIMEGTLEEDEEAFCLIVRIAEGKLDIDAAESWIRTNMVPMQRSFLAELE